MLKAEACRVQSAGLGPAAPRSLHSVIPLLALTHSKASRAESRAGLGANFQPELSPRCPPPGLRAALSAFPISGRVAPRARRKWTAHPYPRLALGGPLHHRQ